VLAAAQDEVAVQDKRDAIDVRPRIGMDCFALFFFFIVLLFVVVLSDRYYKYRDPGDISGHSVSFNEPCSAT
jgi:hypothetical protein